MITQEAYSYKFDEVKCSSCEGNCCIGESGYIWINKSEILALSKYLNITQSELGLKYLRKVSYKYSLKEVRLLNDNFACIFFDTTKKQCSIYDVRPNQCRTFPFWEYFKENKEEVIQECPAIVN